MGAPLSPSALWRSLLREGRCRRYFLRADAKQNAVLVAVTSLVTVALVRNDFVLLREGPLLVVSVATRVVHLAVSILALAQLRRVRSTREHDRVVTGWLWATTGLALTACVTRIPVGEFQGPLVTLGAMMCALLFAQRSPAPQRSLAGAVLVGTAFVMLWHPSLGTTPAGRTAGTICFVALFAVGVFSARAFDEQRRERVRAEHEEKRVRRALADKVSELAGEKARVEALSHARATFLATMSHEFRTPMNAVIGLSGVMLEDPTVAHRQHVRTIHDSARALLVLLEDVLDFAKIDAKQLSLAPAPHDLRRLAASVGEMLCQSAVARGLVLEVEIDANVPALVVVDDARLRQVLVNLVSNAIKFTERGSVRLAMKVDSATSRASTESSVRIEVEDSGVGMAPSTLERIFEPFYQAHEGIARKHGGTGLGLATSREIVRVMGSDIEVRSELGRGTTFSFTLRLPTATAGEGREVDDTIRPGARELPPMAILVVDDEPINRMVASVMLERFGQHPDFASGGEEALAAVAGRVYDLVLMDVHMPGMSGLEVTKRILQRHGRSAPHVVAMTASAFDEDRRACRDAGMRGFLVKPLEPNDLAAALRRTADERRIEPSAGPALPSEGADSMA